MYEEIDTDLNTFLNACYEQRGVSKNDDENVKYCDRLVEIDAFLVSEEAKTGVLPVEAVLAGSIMCLVCHVTMHIPLDLFILRLTLCYSNWRKKMETRLLATKIILHLINKSFYADLLNDLETVLAHAEKEALGGRHDHVEKELAKIHSILLNRAIFHGIATNEIICGQLALLCITPNLNIPLYKLTIESVRKDTRAYATKFRN